MSETSSVKFVLADSPGIVRAGLRALIGQRENWTVVGEVDTGDAAVELVRQFEPDVVIIDVMLPGMDGIETTQRIVQLGGKSKIIALAAHTDKQFITGTLKAGGHAYLLKNCLFEELVSAINAVTSGRTYLSPQVASVVVEDYVKENAPAKSSPAASLTAKEREVLGLLTTGMSCKEVASQLQVSNKTVHACRRRLMEKLKIYDMARLTKFAIKEGLTNLDF